MTPLGRISAIRGATAIVRPAPEDDVLGLRRGDVLALSWASSTDGTDPPFRTGRLVVAALDRARGEVTFTRPVHDQVVAAVGHEEFGDWLYLVATDGEQ